MTERTFVGRPWFAHLGVAKHACYLFDFNLASGLSEMKATLCAAKVQRSMVTGMSQHIIIKVLGLFMHSTNRAVLLKAELEKLILLVIVKGGTYVTTIENDYSRPQGAHVLEPIDGTTVELENHISNNVISAGLKI